MADKLRGAVVIPSVIRRTWAYKRERFRVWKKACAVLQEATGNASSVAYMQEYMRLEMRAWAYRYREARWADKRQEERYQMSFVSDLEIARGR